MRKRDIRMDYRGWLIRGDAPLIPRDRVWKNYFDAKFGGIDIDENEIKETIEDTLNSSLDSKFCGVHRHIEEAKDHLCCDICCAKKDIKKHIDEKFDAVNFEEEFSNLNEQAEAIIQKLNSLT